MDSQGLSTSGASRSLRRHGCATVPAVRGASTGLPDRAWDAEVLGAGGHFLQLTAWLQVQQQLGLRVLWQRGDGWRWAGVVRRSHGVSSLYAPYGPCVDAADVIVPAIHAMREAAQARGLDFVRVEPDLDAESVSIPGARRTGGGQPRHTLVLDLRRPEEELRGEMTSGRRRSINTAAKKGIEIRRSRRPEDASMFIDLIAKTADRNRFHPHPDSYYRTLCDVLFPLDAASLYTAWADGVPVAAVIGFESATTSYYTHAAADAERSRKIIAAAPLAWQMIVDAREQGRTTYDFWGVLAEDAEDHPWAGFSSFKKTFGGRVLTRPGTFDIPVRRLRYAAYDTARRLLRRGAPVA
jgi:hypothetical protein